MAETGWSYLGVPLSAARAAIPPGHIDRTPTGESPRLSPALSQALGVQVSRADGTIARISGATARSLTELTQAFPVQVIDPGVHKLVEEGANRRRRWMDWAVFHVEHQFGDWWVRYTRTLRQRNAALRTQPAQVTVWDAELIKVGELIAESRRRFIESLLPFWRESVVALSAWSRSCITSKAGLKTPPWRRPSSPPRLATNPSASRTGPSSR